MIQNLLESIDGSENSPDEHVCETTEAWHGLACTVLLRSAFACVFGLVFRFSCHSICRLPFAACGTRRLVAMRYTDGKCWGEKAWIRG